MLSKDKNCFRIIGCMSGTSLDGLDMADVLFEKQAERWSFTIKNALTIQYPKVLQAGLKGAIRGSQSEINSLDAELGTFMGKAIFDQFQSELSEIDFVASHGHTVFHQPAEGITLQVGSAQKIFQETGLAVINDFRTHDLQLGGEGAPLVPVGDRDLFSEYDVCLNLGGIANASFDKNGDRLAFDICPFNMALNEMAGRMGLAYDNEGMLGRAGKIDLELLKKLNSIYYFEKRPPKSLGLEDYLSEWKPILDNAAANEKDLLATLVEHFSFQIANSIDMTGGQSNVLVTGGGAYNTFFLERLDEHFQGRLVLPSDEVIQFKEAIVFAYLGLLRFLGQNNCLSSVTGASRDHSSGMMLGF